MGVRFGDHGPGWTVLFEGCDVTHRSRQAWAGADGWVQMVFDVNGLARLCEQCQQDVAVQLIYGNVEIRYRPPDWR